MTEIDRFVSGSLESSVLQAVVCILGLPRDVPVEALVVVNGQGELIRTSQVVSEWNQGSSAKHLIITGAGIGEKTCRSFDMEDLVENFGLTRMDSVHAQGYPVPDTRQHAEWVVGQLEGLGVTSVAVYATLYHLPRVFLTLIRYLKNHGLDRQIAFYPRPIQCSPFASSPETGHTLFDLMPGEFARIIKYGSRGDIASLEELREYLDWLWGQQ